tara:strand:- start:38122 stop:38298 length:177 start_codon:yes stop_codon:yes gene_type:complete
MARKIILTFENQENFDMFSKQINEEFEEEGDVADFVTKKVTREGNLKINIKHIPAENL